MMRDRRAEADRTFKRALWGGLAASVALHGALLAFGQLSLPSFGGADSTGPRLVSLPADIEAESPLEVVNIQPVEAAAEAGGASAAASAALARLPSMNAVLSAAIPSPGVMMDLIELPAKEEAAAVTYASAGGFGNSAASVSSYRSTDGRSVAVLAAIGGERGTYGGFGIGGGHCPPGGFNQAMLISR
ncbi:MAG: hypothetical protein ABFS14_03825 [Gemmatimonadota bacterium]